MLIRPYTFLDYATIKDWADQRKFPLVPPEFLPSVGFIVPGHCVGFVYQTDSAIAWLEWIISNPEVQNNDALSLLIETACQAAKGRGYKVIFTTVEHKGLIERYKHHEFNVTDTGVTNMLRKL